MRTGGRGGPDHGTADEKPERSADFPGGAVIPMWSQYVWRNLFGEISKILLTISSVDNIVKLEISILDNLSGLRREGDSYEEQKENQAHVPSVPVC